MTSPTVVLVPGAWHTPVHYDPFVKFIPDIDVRIVRLGSSGHDVVGLGDMYGDAAEVRKAVSSIDGPVLVLAHSYGGVPVTEALGTVTENVGRTVYLASFDGLTCQSWSSLVQPVTNTAWRMIPSTCIVADEDRALPPAAQEFFAQRASETRHIGSSHSPFLSRQAELATMLREELSRLG
ncbi:MAG: alpha/beta fold hydrolase [Trebonia sp.]